MIPAGTARPKAWVAWSTLPRVAPPDEDRSGLRIDDHACIGDRSITSPLSTPPRPAPSRRRCGSRRAGVVASETAATTSAVSGSDDRRRPLVDHRVVERACLVDPACSIDVAPAQKQLELLGAGACRSLDGCHSGPPCWFAGMTAQKQIPIHTPRGVSFLPKGDEHEGRPCGSGTDRRRRLCRVDRDVSRSAAACAGGRVPVRRPQLQRLRGRRAPGPPRRRHDHVHDGASDGAGGGLRFLSLCSRRSCGT